jgi:hypothetical protein
MTKEKTVEERIREQVEVFVDCSGKKLGVAIFEKSNNGDVARWTIMNENRELVTYQGVQVEPPESLVKIFRKDGLLDQINEKTKSESGGEND